MTDIEPAPPRMTVALQTSEAYQELKQLPDYVAAFLEGFKGDKVALAAVLLTHRQVIQQMKQLDTLIESCLLECNIAYGGERIEGVGTVMVHKAGKKVRYDNDALISEIAAELADRTGQADPETGEVPTPVEATQMAVEAMADLVGARAPSFNSWRKTTARAHKIELDKYSSEEGGRLSVRFEA